MMDNVKRMKELVSILSKADQAYYSEDGAEIMDNREYDSLYDELKALEEESGVVLSGSPTQRVGYEILSELPKEPHPSPMLSLDKTKDRDALAAWLGDNKGLLSWKLDGLTVVLTYDNGELVKAVTRGNGQVGEVITSNAKTFVNLPLKIGYQGELTLRGEAVISYQDFMEINDAIPEMEAKYKNPRNLCSGSVRQLNSAITAQRRVRFYAFSLVTEIPEQENSRHKGMEWLRAQGFDVVDYVLVTGTEVKDAVQSFEDKIESNPIPSDGLVLVLDDISYSKSLGTTAKFPRDSIAFKWRDQIAETKLLEIEWSASRTGLINPIAVFEPVELEGTTVSRASLHNVSIMEDLELGIGDTIEVYKANMIIPQVASNITRSGAAEVPKACPVCGGATELRNENGVKTLFCTEPTCLAKHIKRFSHFVSRDAMDIEGMSEMTMDKLVGAGLIHSLPDIYRLGEHRSKIVTMEGFGDKSFDKLVSAIDESRHRGPDRLLYALGIQGIGLANARVIADKCKNSWDKMINLTEEELKNIDGIGDIMASAYASFFRDERNKEEVVELVKLLDIDESYVEKDDYMSGVTFVITGSLNNYANREELKSLLESAGAKVAGSVSGSTTYLINNDVSSNSGKNKKAKELGIPIVDEAKVTEWLRNKRID